MTQHRDPEAGLDDTGERPLEEVIGEQVALLTEAALRARSCLQVDDLRGAFAATCAAQTAGALAAEVLVAALTRKRSVTRGCLEPDHR
ncbi:hypothetical protein [Streptomyces sp. NPDC059788]|uniref:hypothetical protein n=1 Tax=Streptomyces sp. NPDC059788 TaxID=3346948 RepID=UPI00366A17A2